MPPQLAKPLASVDQPAATERMLGSPPRKRMRVVVCGLLCGLSLISTAAWIPKLFFIVTMVLICGSWRLFQVRKKSVWNRWTIAFFDLTPQTAKFRRFDYIEIVYQQPTGAWELLLFGPVAFLFGWVTNTLAPGIAGSYQLWLNNSHDDRVLVWQGSNQAEFESTLETLKQASGLATQTR